MAPIPPPKDCIKRLGPTVTMVGSEEVRRMYFQTTTSREFAGRQPEGLARCENLADVHLIGARESKYMKYQRKKAPLVDRTATRYIQDYMPLPLGGGKLDRELAENFRSVAGQSYLTVPEGTRLNDATKYSEDFRPLSAKQTKGAKAKSAKPKQGRTTTMPTGDLLEKRSVSHAQFQTPNHSLGRAARAHPPRSNLGASMHASALPKTSYRREFVAWEAEEEREEEAEPRAAAPAPAPAQAQAPAAEAPTTRPMQRCTSAPLGGRRRPCTPLRVAGGGAGGEPRRPASAGTSGPQAARRVHAEAPSTAGSSVAPAWAGVIHGPEDHIWHVRRACFLSPGQ